MSLKNPLRNLSFEEIKNIFNLRGLDFLLYLDYLETLKKRKKLDKNLNELNRLKKENNYNQNKDKIKEIKKELIIEKEKEEILRLQIPNKLDEFVINSLKNINFLKEGLILETNIIEKEKEFVSFSKLEDSKYKLYSTKEEVRNIVSQKAGFILYYSKGALLKRKLIDFFLNHNILNDYEELSFPILVSKNSLKNTKQYPKMKEDLFVCEDLFLNPTVECQIMNFFNNKIIKTPIRITSYSPSFRKEIGKNKEIKSITRVHQFDKVEIVSVFSKEEKEFEFNKIINTIKSLLNSLKLSYRIKLLHPLDMNSNSMKTYDFEVFLPISKIWLEVSSASLMGDTQTSELNCKTINNDFCYSINASSLSIPRIIAALIETYGELENNKLKINIPILNFDYLSNY